MLVLTLGLTLLTTTGLPPPLVRLVMASMVTLNEKELSVHTEEVLISNWITGDEASL